MLQIPDALINEIHDGNCGAFVGAGFSAAVIPPWGELLSKLATQSEVATDIKSHVESLVHKGSAHAFDEAAQVLEDHLGRATFLDQLAALLTQRNEGRMSQRLTHLRGIPFRSILTTNFDTLLPGSTPGPEAYRSVLRPEAFRWWETRYWGNAQGAVTLKLHGDVAKREIVLTRRDYRRQLYSDPAYITFLRHDDSDHDGPLHGLLLRGRLPERIEVRNPRSPGTGRQKHTCRLRHRQ